MSASVGKRPCLALGHSGPIRGSSCPRDDGSREMLTRNSCLWPLRFAVLTLKEIAKIISRDFKCVLDTTSPKEGERWE